MSPGDEKGSVDEYFTRFLENLLHLFTTERNLLEDRGPFIIRLVRILHSNICVCCSCDLRPKVNQHIALYDAEDVSKVAEINPAQSNRQLCVMLSAEDIYRTLAELLQQEENLIFASEMVQTLSSILLTSKELFTLRIQLKDLATPVIFRNRICVCVYVHAHECEYMHVCVHFSKVHLMKLFPAPTHHLNLQL